MSADNVARADQEVGLPLGDLVFQSGGYHRQSVSMTGSLCLSQTVGVRNIQVVLFTDSMCRSQTYCVCHTQFVWESTRIAIWFFLVLFGSFEFCFWFVLVLFLVL